MCDVLHLAYRGIDVVSLNCIFCGLVEASVQHCFLDCSSIKPLWMKLGSWWGIDLSSAILFKDVVTTAVSTRSGKCVAKPSTGAC